jgi:hypothetical protein
MECQMNPSITKSCLSPAQARLFELLQGLNFGRVEGLRVRAGEPIFDPPPRVIQTVKLRSNNDPRPERSYSDFRLKRQIVEMLDIVSSLGDGEVRSIDVRHGLPHCMEIDRPPDYSVERLASDAIRSGRTVYLPEEPLGDNDPEKDGAAR